MKNIIFFLLLFFTTMSSNSCQVEKDCTAENAALITLLYFNSTPIFCAPEDFQKIVYHNKARLEEEGSCIKCMKKLIPFLQGLPYDSELEQSLRDINRVLGEGQGSSSASLESYKLGVELDFLVNAMPSASRKDWTYFNTYLGNTAKGQVMIAMESMGVDFSMMRNIFQQDSEFQQQLNFAFEKLVTEIQESGL